METSRKYLPHICGNESRTHCEQSERDNGKRPAPQTGHTELGSMRMSISGGAGRTPPLLFALHARCQASAPYRSLSAQRGSQRPPRRRSFVPQRSPALPDPEPNRFGPPKPGQVSVSGPEDSARSDRPAIRRTMPDGLIGPLKKDAPIVVQCGSGDITELSMKHIQICYTSSASDTNMLNRRLAITKDWPQRNIRE
jgi:hypothetical protein